jgi:hypothetical protein
MSVRCCTATKIDGIRVLSCSINVWSHISGPAQLSLTLTEAKG